MKPLKQNVVHVRHAQKHPCCRLALSLFLFVWLSTGSCENENRKVVMDIAKIHKQKDVWLNSSNSSNIRIITIHHSGVVAAAHARNHNVKNHFPWAGTMISEVLLWKWVDSGSGVVFMECYRSYSHHTVAVVSHFFLAIEYCVWLLLPPTLLRHTHTIIFIMDKLSNANRVWKRHWMQTKVEFLFFSFYLSF